MSNSRIDCADYDTKNVNGNICIWNDPEELPLALQADCDNAVDYTSYTGAKVDHMSLKFNLVPMAPVAVQEENQQSQETCNSEPEMGTNPLPGVISKWTWKLQAMELNRLNHVPNSRPEKNRMKIFPRF